MSNSFLTAQGGLVTCSEFVKGECCCIDPLLGLLRAPYNHLRNCGNFIVEYIENLFIQG